MREYVSYEPIQLEMAIVTFNANKICINWNLFTSYVSIVHWDIESNSRYFYFRMISHDKRRNTIYFADELFIY